MLRSPNGVHGSSLVPSFFLPPCSTDSLTVDYCVQGHRFDIYEDLGCYPNTYASVAALILIYLPPFLVSLASGVYASKQILS